MNIYSASRPPRTFGITSPLSLDGPSEKDEVLTSELHSKYRNSELFPNSFSRNNRTVWSIWYSWRTFTSDSSSNSFEWIGQDICQKSGSREKYSSSFTWYTWWKDLYFWFIQIGCSHKKWWYWYTLCCPHTCYKNWFFYHFSWNAQGEF